MGTKYDWNTTYAASEYLGGRNVSVAQGKIVGGSTKLNRMVFDRGAKSDYDGWEALGNEGWNWESLLPYFKKVSQAQDHSCHLLTNTERSLFPARRRDPAGIQYHLGRGRSWLRWLHALNLLNIFLAHDK